MSTASQLRDIIIGCTTTGEWQILSKWLSDDAWYAFNHAHLDENNGLAFNDLEPLLSLWRAPKPVSEELLYEIARFCNSEWRRLDIRAKAWMMENMVDLFTLEDVSHPG